MVQDRAGAGRQKADDSEVAPEFPVSPVQMVARLSSDMERLFPESSGVLGISISSVDRFLPRVLASPQARTPMTGSGKPWRGSGKLVPAGGNSLARQESG